MQTVINGIEVEFGPRTAVRCVAFVAALCAVDDDGDSDVVPP